MMSSTSDSHPPSSNAASGGSGLLETMSSVSSSSQSASGTSASPPPTSAVDASSASDSKAPTAAVVIDYSELLHEETSAALREKIEQGFGYEGLGIVAIRNVPEFAAKRLVALPFSEKFGNLPESTKSKYVHAESFYSFGWSHGKEKLEGKPDVAKGSFYFNPIHDRPFEDEATIKAHPAFAHPNIWPSEEDCGGFVAASKDCAALMVSVGELLARHCDAYVRGLDPSYGGGLVAGAGSGGGSAAAASEGKQEGKHSTHALTRIIKEGRCHKARLLYYFPYRGGGGTATTSAASEAAATPSAASASAAGADDDVSSWCGWHNDHGSLTGLTPAMFFNAEGGPIPCPDPAAGLYVRTRQNRTVRVALPPDCIAYQIGETAQVHTGGLLQATPHCVRAAQSEGVSRGALAVFMEPEWDEAMDVPPGADKERVLRGAKGELLPKGVPQLIDRWMGGGQTFGEFTAKTLSMYY